jgi:serine protease Do
LMTIDVRSGLRPSESELAKLSGQGGDEEDQSGPTESRGPTVLGLNVAPITPGTRNQYSIPQNATGVVITEVQPHTEAARDGLHPGDLVIMVNEQPISSPAQFQSAVNAAKAAGRPSVLLLVQRDGRNVPVPLHFETTKK